MHNSRVMWGAEARLQQGNPFLDEAWGKIRVAGDKAWLDWIEHVDNSAQGPRLTCCPLFENKAFLKCGHLHLCTYRLCVIEWQNCSLVGPAKP